MKQIKNCNCFDAQALKHYILSNISASYYTQQNIHKILKIVSKKIKK